MAGVTLDVDCLRGSPIEERAVADIRYACGYGYAGKAGATSERDIADRRYAIGDGYAGKAGATVERSFADRRYAIGDGYIAAYSSRSLNQDSFCLVVQYPVLACVIGIVHIYYYAGKAGATEERVEADRRYARADGYAGKSSQIVKFGG